MKKLCLAIMAVVLTACSTLPNYRALAKQVVPANVQLVGNFTNFISGEDRRDSTYCSGVAITPTHILTAGHCTEIEQGANQWVMVETKFDGKVKIKYKGKFYFARVAKSVLVNDEKDNKDSALLILDEPVLTPVVLGDSDSLQQGDQVAIVGNTFGELYDSFTVGVVAYANRQVFGFTWIQSTANAAGGNSGGGTYDMDGKLVGLLTHGIDGIASLSIPINKVLKDLELDGKQK